MASESISGAVISFCLKQHGAALRAPQIMHMLLHMHITDKLRARFDVKVDRSGGLDACWPWTAATLPKGYGYFSVGSRTDGTQRTAYAHRVAYTIAHGPIPDGLHVLHKCDSPGCCNPAHLRVGTNRDNVNDMVTKCRQSRGDAHWSRADPSRVPRGESRGRSKLRTDDVRKIRSRRDAGETMTALASAFGVSASVIRMVVLRKSWTHVD